VNVSQSRWKPARHAGDEANEGRGVTVYTTSKRLGDIVSEMWERVEGDIGLLQ
jgi:hypothetical protein